MNVKHLVWSLIAAASLVVPASAGVASIEGAQHMDANHVSGSASTLPGAVRRRAPRAFWM